MGAIWLSGHEDGLQAEGGEAMADPRRPPSIEQASAFPSLTEIPAWRDGDALQGRSTRQ